MDSSSSSSVSFNEIEWKAVVNRVLNVWSGYQLAIDNAAGGPETKEKHQWFGDILSEHIHATHALKVDNLEEWMENILYTDFDLVLEDDSIFPTAHLLMDLHRHLKKNNRMALEQLLSTLPTEETVRLAKKSSRQGADDESVSGESDMELPEENEKEDDEDPDHQPRERQPRTVTDDDGWTTIVTRK